MSQEAAAFGHRWFEEVWNKGRVSAIDELMTSECRVCGLGDDLIGPQAFKSFHAAYRNAFPDLNVVVDDTIAEDDRVVLRWTATATHAGDGLGFPATGKKVQFTGISIARVENGKLVEGWNSFDQLGMLQQLGVVAAPA